MIYVLTLPWALLQHPPAVAVSPKVHLLNWYTSGFE